MLGYRKSGHTYFIAAKVAIKSYRRARDCFIYTCIWLHMLELRANSYRVVNYSYIAIFNWFVLGICFVTFCYNPYFLLNF